MRDVAFRAGVTSALRVARGELEARIKNAKDSPPGLEFRHFRGKATWPLVLSFFLGHKGQILWQEGHQLKQDFCPMTTIFFTDVICTVDNLQ